LRIRDAVVQVFLATAFSLSGFAADVQSLTWLTGCWRSADGSVTEQWMKPEGGTMLGMNRTVAAGKTVAWEFLRIVQDENGTVSFIALPSGQKETAFRLTKSGDREATFENPDHDFPQRVIYRLREDGSLLGRIEGISKGKHKSADFPLNRVSCDQ
jgi:hypothetical protein